MDDAGLNGRRCRGSGSTDESLGFSDSDGKTWQSGMLTVGSSCVDDAGLNGRRRRGSGSTDESLGFSDSDGKTWQSPSDECRFSGEIGISTGRC